jgi:tRNA pseudouridine32 synthase / 23S rRNA pseudouridine746 synthase
MSLFDLERLTQAPTTEAVLRSSNSSSTINTMHTTSSSSSSSSPSSSSSSSHPTTTTTQQRLLLENSFDTLLTKHARQRQLALKMAAERQASRPLSANRDLHVLYCDEHICVVDKPSGVLSVPGPRRNPSLASLVHQVLYYNNSNCRHNDDGRDSSNLNGEDEEATRRRDNLEIDKMVVHRLDMDTSGILVFALTEHSLKRLHIDFRNKGEERDNNVGGGGVKKTYEALLLGHVNIDASSSLSLSAFAECMEIDIALERDPLHPPFMRIAQPRTTGKQQQLMEAVQGENTPTTKNASPETRMYHSSFAKFINQQPKPSLTELKVLSWEYLHAVGGGDDDNDDDYNDNSNSSRSRNKNRHDQKQQQQQQQQQAAAVENKNTRIAVTRVELVPKTGRTHQLRVHCAALGHPIVGDDIYGPGGVVQLGEDWVGVAGAGAGTAKAVDGKSNCYFSATHATNMDHALCLHARQLCFHHPFTGAPMVFESEAPF